MNEQRDSCAMPRCSNLQRKFRGKLNSRLCENHYRASNATTRQQFSLLEKVRVRPHPVTVKLQERLREMPEAFVPVVNKLDAGSSHWKRAEERVLASIAARGISLDRPFFNLDGTPRRLLNNSRYEKQR